MASLRMTLLDLLNKSEQGADPNFLRDDVQLLAQELMDAEVPYLFLDATFEKVRENGRVISMAVLIAVGVRSTGEREVVGVDVGPAEDHEFWLQFLRQLVSRGLSGVGLVISDSHLGLKQAAGQVFVRSTCHP